MRTTLPLLFVKYIAQIFLITGGILFLVSLIFLFGRIVFLMGSIKAEGIVTHVETRKGDQSYSRGIPLRPGSSFVSVPTITYKTEAGEEYTYRQKYASESTLNEGDRITIAYSKKNPAHAVQYSFKTLWMFQLIGIISGLILLILGKSALMLEFN